MKLIGVRLQRTYLTTNCKKKHCATSAKLSNILDKNIKAKENFAGNQFYNIFRLSDVLPNFASTTSETMGDYYL